LAELWLNTAWVLGVLVMRLVFSLLATATFLGGSVSAQAYEKFIPLGAGYSTEISSLPALNSEAEAIINQSDVYETEIYIEQLEAKRRESYMQRFMFGTENAGSDFSIDY
jgi:hypothetical protein